MGLFSKRSPLVTEDSGVTETNGIAGVLERASGTGPLERGGEDAQAGMEHADSGLAPSVVLALTVREPHGSGAVPDSQMHALNAHIAGFEQAGNDLAAVGDLISALQDRMPDMHRFAKHLRTEAAQNAEIVAQRNEYQQQCTALEDVAQRQTEKIDDLESSLEVSTKLQENLKANLIALQSELEAERESNARLRERDQTVSGELEARAIRISTLESETNRRISEITRLGDAKSKAEKALSKLQRDMSELECGLAERDLKLDKLSKAHEQVIADRKRSTEERTALRRDLSAIQTSLADSQIRIDRLKAENEGYVKRLAAEKFSMSKDREALVAEMEGLRAQGQETYKELEALKDRYERLEREREEAHRRLKEVEATVDNRRAELRTANNSISEISLKYAADLLTIDQLRDENRDLRSRLELLQADQQRLREFEAQYKSSENRANQLEAKLAEHVKMMADKGKQRPASRSAKTEDAVAGHAVEEEPAAEAATKH